MRGRTTTLTASGCLTAFFGCLLLGAADEASAAIPASERAALIALYNGTNGAGWTRRTNWRNATDTDFAPPGTECTWAGVRCWADDSHVSGLHLYSNQLTGTLPPEIGYLTDLEDLNLWNNQLSGSIPPEIGNLTLTYLSLSDNQLTGPIPPNLKIVLYLFLDNNQLTGPIPPEIGNLSFLQVLSLSNNQLTGSIPAGIGNLIWFHELHLDHNQLSGPIPPEIGTLVMGGTAGYGSLYLDHNQLSGPIPAEIGSVRNLGRLFLSSNQLTGPIPSQIGNLTRLEDLDVSENQLTGPIPHQIGYLTWLEHLKLASNQISGPIPAGIGNLARLVELDLGGNQLSGPIPPQLGTLGLVSTLHLQGNQLGGPIPATITNMTGLVDGLSDLRWNALYTSDAALKALLDSKQIGGDWEGTQTVTPTGLVAGTAAPDSVPLSWSPILYTGDTGGYRLWYGTLAGGPYNLGGTTADKAASAAAVSGLSPGTTYYFARDTVTRPHANNQNTVVSERSAEVSATTTVGGLDWYGLTVVRDGPGIASSSPSGIACGGVCAAAYAPGTLVTLTVTTDAGSTFLGWGGACAGTALTCDLTMDSAQTVTATFATPPLSFYSVTPCRAYDSRDAGLGGPGALAVGADKAIVVAGYCGIPATAKAVSLNVTVVSPSAAGHLRLFASGAPRPDTSSINYASGQTRANNAVVELGADGELLVYLNQPSGTAHVVLDVNGYFQ